MMVTWPNLVPQQNHSRSAKNTTGNQIKIHPSVAMILIQDSIIFHHIIDQWLSNQLLLHIEDQKSKLQNRVSMMVTSLNLEHQQSLLRLGRKSLKLIIAIQALATTIQMTRWQSLKLLLPLSKRNLTKCQFREKITHLQVNMMVIWKLLDKTISEKWQLDLNTNGKPMIIQLLANMMWKGRSNQSDTNRQRHLSRSPWLNTKDHKSQHLSHMTDIWSLSVPM